MRESNNRQTKLRHQVDRNGDDETRASGLTFNFNRGMLWTANTLLLVPCLDLLERISVCTERSANFNAKNAEQGSARFPKGGVMQNA